MQSHYHSQKSFNTQPPKGGWLGFAYIVPFQNRFNTQPPKGGWFGVDAVWHFPESFNTQPPKGGWIFENGTKVVGGVSTHSRLKAAGFI